MAVVNRSSRYTLRNSYARDEQLLGALRQARPALGCRRSAMVSVVFRWRPLLFVPRIEPLPLFPFVELLARLFFTGYQ